MENDMLISITHFINPQLFWYHTVEAPNPSIQEVISIEQQLLNIYKYKNVVEKFQPAVNDKIAVHFLPWEKYIRAKVLNVLTDECMLWALDYGFPFQTALRYIRRLPATLSQQFDHIRCGGLSDIRPAQKEFDFMEGRVMMIEKDMWSQPVTENLESMLNDAASIIFIEQFQTVDHFWGDLQITNHKGNKFLVRDYLLEMNSAVDCTANFHKICHTLKPTKVPQWKTNDEKVKLKQNLYSSVFPEWTIRHRGDNEPCDDIAKRKVEDWCARNQKAAGTFSSTEPPEFNLRLSVDDVTFDDSVSNKNMNLAEGGKEVPSEQFIGRGGILLKARKAKYIDGQIPPKPTSQAFQVNTTEETHEGSQCKSEVSKSSGDDIKDDITTTSSVALSLREKQLLELRKKLHNQGGQMPSSNQTVNSSALNYPKSNMSSEENSSIGASGSVMSAREKKLLELRRKHIITGVAPPESVTAASEVDSDFTIASKSSYMDKLKKEREMHSAQSTSSHSDKEETTSVASTGSSKYLNYLANARNMVQKNIIDQKSSETREPVDQNSIIYKKVPLGVNENNNRNHYPDFASSLNEKLSEKNSKPTPPAPFKMVPAGFDLMNLYEYKDEKNHWHRKKTTLHDKVPHDDMARRFEPNKSITSSGSIRSSKRSFDESNILSQLNISSNSNKSSINQNFRHTRSHSDKYKEDGGGGGGVHVNMESILDTSVPVTNENVLNPIPEAKCILDNKTDPKLERISLFNDDLLTLANEQCDLTSSSNISNELEKIPENVPHTNKNVLLHSHVTESESNSTVEYDLLSFSTDQCDQSSTLNISTSTELVEKSKPDVSESKISPIAMANEEPNTVLPTKEQSSLLSSSSLPSNNSLQKYKRRVLKSPATQMHTIDQILRNANLEKERGNTNILDLNNINTSVGSRTDSDSNVEQNTADDSVTSDQETKTSNKSALVANRRSTHNQINPSDAKTTAVHEKLNRLNQSHSQRNKKIPIIIPMPLSQKLPEIKGEHCLQTKFIDHLVLAHSKVPLFPIENLSDAYFLQEIQDEMVHRRLTKVYRIQAYSWSHLMRGNSLVVVNPSKSGKTWSYLPAICSLVSYRIQSGMLPQTYGPVAIILVASAMHVEHVNNDCKRLLVSVKHSVTTVPSFGVRNSNETKIQLLNSCGILVATPSSLLRLIRCNENESLIDPMRLQHLVVDDMDLMVSRSKSDFQTVLKSIFKLSKKAKSQTLPMQLVVTTRDWDTSLVSLLRHSNQPLLLIGDFLEAAVYGRAVISIKLRSREQKMTSLLHFIENHPIERERMLVLCNCDEDVRDITEALSASGLAVIAYTSKSTSDVRATIDEWKQEIFKTQILVCTDSGFPELQIQNVQNLVHYSMPTSWTKFTSRFAALARTYTNYVCKDFNDLKDEAASTAHSLILLDEENSIQLPRLIDFMKKHHQQKSIPPKILAVSKRVLLQREDSRVTMGSLLCPYLLEFAECDVPHCDYRHNLQHFDIFSKKDDIPTAGDMRILILKVVSPTHYTARLLQHKPHNSGKWYDVRRSNETALFSMQLNMHYMKRDNLLLHWPPAVNDLCVYKVADAFQRAHILEVPPLKHKDVVQTVQVTLRLIDVGTVIHGVKSDELLVCDNKFKKFPAQAIDIRLMGVVPFDNERTWDTKATKSVRDWIMTGIAKNECVHVSINFAMANTIWVNNVIVMEQLPTVGQYVYRVNLKRSLIEKNYALLSGAMERQNIRDIAEEMGLLDHQDATADMTEITESCKYSTSLAKCSTNEDDTMGGYTPLLNATSTTPGDTKDEESWDNLDEDVIHVPHRGESFRVNTTITPESWCTLPMHQIVKVEIGDENNNGNWSDIYLQPIDEMYKEKFDELMGVVNAHVESLKISKQSQRDYTDLPSWMQPMQNCIVKHDKLYLRAKLFSIKEPDADEHESNAVYTFFLCDYACFIGVKACELFNDFLYETTPQIVTFIPYQAVHSTLAGIQMKEPCADYHRVTKEFLFAYAVSEVQTSTTLTDKGIAIQSYEILFYECDGENDLTGRELVNKALLKCGVATLNPNTGHYLELDTTIDLAQSKERYDDDDDGEGDKSTKSNENADKVVSFAELLKCVQRSLELEAEEMAFSDDAQGKEMRKALLRETKAICAATIEKHDETVKSIKLKKPTTSTVTATPPENEVEDLINFSSTSDTNRHTTNKTANSSSDNNDADVEDEANLPPPPPLYGLNKRPPTTWYETDCLIYITIHAPDVGEYFLEVTKDMLYWSATVHEIEKVLILHFMGTVEPQHVSHEKRGLNVVVRLVKSIFMKWPRLLKQSTKFPWLTYNFEAIDNSEMEHILAQQRLQLALENSSNRLRNDYDSDSDSDNSENNLFQTFTPIVNSEDIHDPTVELL